FMAHHECPAMIKSMLSLYNDAIHTDNVFFRFLCLYKIFDVFFCGDNNSIKTWMNDNLKLVCDKSDYIERKVRNLNQNNIGYYLYKNFRNAIAHAHLGKIKAGKLGLMSYNPEDFGKAFEACEILKALVECLIEKELDRFDREGINVIKEV
ncbi:MAG: hypothetical protein Q4E99_02215, partial [Bacillota bacterium]|nr:hypothetical protein [Bacillota bacterium]